MSHGGRVFQILGYTPSARWSKYDGSLKTTVSSFDDLTDRAALNVQPMRVDVVRAPREMTLTSFETAYPSSVDVQKLALINGIDPGAKISSGDLVKRVVAGGA